MKLILINGAPGAGKDTAASILTDLHCEKWSIVNEKFARPFKRAFAAITNSRMDSSGDRVVGYEDRKEEIIPWLGVSYRQWMIDFAETFMKPRYGNAIFARMFLDRTALRAATDHYLCIVSDCGFQIEVDTIIANWPKSEDVMLLTIVRKDTTFNGDSRSYVSATKITVNNWRVIYNNGTLEELKAELIVKTKAFLS